MVRYLRRLSLGFGLLVLFGGILQAQLDLPKGKKRSARKGLELPARPGGDLAPKTSKTPPGGGLDGGTKGTGLELPPGASDSPGGGGGPETSASYDATLHGAARFILDELAKVRSAEGSVARDALDSLAALGEPGLAEARRMLSTDHAPTLVVCGRLLLLHGRPEDHRLVADRLQARIPSPAAQPLLTSLVELDPVLASPGYLASLLDHRSGAVRSAAHRHLEAEVGPDLLPHLARLLQSRRSDTRLRCVELANGIEDDAIQNLLVQRLGDESPKVAMRCAELLASRGGDEVLDALQQRAFGGPRLDRGAAYAVLALILREELGETPLLDERHVPVLLAGLRAGDPLLVGASAAALAGIGFRSPHAADTPWLDLEVPHQLVRLAAGVEFYADFSSLQGVVSRRLALISGQHFGTDGYAWQSWWTEAAADFRARRAVIDWSEGMESTLEVVLRDGPRSEDLIVLRGPDVPERASAFESQRGRCFYLSGRECRGLAVLLQREGVFGVERVPGRSPAGVGGVRTLEVSVQGQGKSFSFAPGVQEPWFDRLTSAVRALAEHNRWQLFPDPARFPDARSMSAVEGAWWEMDHSEREEGRRFVGLLFDYLRAVEISERDAAVAELVRLYGSEGIPRAIDLPPLLELLAQESFPGQRADRLVDLSLAAARAVEDPTAGAAVEAVDPVLGRRIVEVLLGAMHDRAGPVVARILAASDDPLVREVATGPDPRLRAIAAGVLARDETAGAREMVFALLEDPEPAVEAAAILALGRAGVEDARNQILLRARTATTEVRVAALLAAGELGGEGVLDVLRMALYEADGRVQLAGAEGLAILADPASAELLVRLFAQGRSAPCFEPARRALLEIGPPAWDELIRVSVSAAEATRRDATLLLAEQGVPAAASNLITLLTKNPRDARVAHELAVLTCIDHREAQDPAQEWWNWWDTVVHGDSFAWLRGAAEREGISTPPEGALEGEPTHDGALFLVRMLESAEDCVAERARRELGRVLGGDVGAAPPRGPLRDEWIDRLRATVRERLPAGGR